MTGIDETNRFDFDEELLLEDSRDPDEASGRYKVEALLTMNYQSQQAPTGINDASF